MIKTIIQFVLYAVILVCVYTAAESDNLIIKAAAVVAMVVILIVLINSGPSTPDYMDKGGR